MAVAQLWDTLTQAIAAYTGLSPAVFFTVLAVAATIYYALSGLFAAPPPPARRSVSLESEPLLPPVQLGEITEEELKQYDGSDPKKPLLMAIKGQIYDVSQSRMFYGPGGPYALFAGKDASRALAKMSFEDKDLNGDISGLGPSELDALQDWEYKFMSKYVKVGTIKKSVHVEEGGASSDAANRDLSTEKDEPKEEVPTSATAGIIEPKEEVPTSATEGVVEPKEEVPEVATGVKERADEIPQQKDSSSADQPEAKKE